MSGIILLTPFINLYGQEANTKKLFNPPVSVNTFLLNFDYTTQQSTTTLVPEDLSQPVLNAGISFYSRSNYDISVLTGIAYNSDTSYSEAAYEAGLSLGYTFNISEYLKLRPSYSHFVYSGNSHPFHSLISDNFQVDFTFENDWYYGGIFIGYLNGTKNTIYTSISNGVNFSKNDVLINHSYLSLGFDIDLNFSDLNYYNEILYDSWDQSEFISFMTNYKAISPENLLFRINDYGIDRVKAFEKDAIAAENPGIFDPKFGISYLNLSAPILYSTRVLSLYALPTLLFPLSDNIFYSRETQFILSFGFSVTIK